MSDSAGNTTAVAGRHHGFSSYPKYKSSGVEWLGDVPEHWEIRRLKYLVSINDEVLSETTAPDYRMRYVDIGGVDYVQGIHSFEDTTFGQAPSRARRIVRHGDTIVSTVRTYLRAIAPICQPAPHTIVSTGFAVLRPRSSLSSRFAYFALNAPGFIDDVVARSAGANYPAINADEIGSIPIAVPLSLDEQRTAARYLDRELAKIDALIARNEASIKRLKEHRTALISRTVTRGLPPDECRKAGIDPHPKFKPSGVEWLGDVPEHWELRRLRHVCRLAYGDSLASRARHDKGSVPVYGSNGQVGLHSTANTHGPCLIIGRKGSYGKISYSPIATFSIDTTYYVDQRHTDADIRWLYYVLEAMQLDAVSRDSAIPGLSRTDTYDRFCLYPSMVEQRTIARYLDRETAKIDKAMTLANQEIELLHEYRTRVITDVVTGKVNVGAVPDMDMEVNREDERQSHS